jgi:DNA helicase-2/ATP-dependent DNA helicase PcrA
MEYRIFGPPGTGKTTRLGKEIERAAEQYGEENVLVASFSRTAASEIAQRGLGGGQMKLGTLHSLALKCIGSMPVIPERKSQALVDEWNTTYPTMKISTAKTFDPDDPWASDEGSCGNDLLEQLNRCRAQMMPAELYDPRVRKFGERWADFKRQTFSIDFTDMIEIALRDTDEAPGGVAAGFFDEAQDFSALEMALARKWGAQMDYYVLSGDDDQAIYQFRGATPEAFLSKDIEHKSTVLGQSWRVPQSVHKVAESWIRRIDKRQPKTYKPMEKAGAVRALDATYKYCDLLVDDIVEQTERGRTCMVLAACSYMLEPLISALREQGIPYHNPYRLKQHSWNPLSQGGEDKLSAGDRVTAYSVPRFNNRFWTPDELKAWVSCIRADGVVLRGKKKVVAGLSGDREMALEELFDYLDPSFLELLIEGDYSYEEIKKRLLAGKRTVEYALTVAEKQGIKALSSEPKIILGTIHSVKGGEADVVYLFPDISLAMDREAVDSSDAADAQTRIFYVGMTRAKEELVICQPVRPRLSMPLEDYV